MTQGATQNYPGGMTQGAFDFTQGEWYIPAPPPINEGPGWRYRDISAKDTSAKDTLANDTSAKRHFGENIKTPNFDQNLKILKVVNE